MKTQNVEYEADGLQMIGHLAWTASEPRPAVLVFPNAGGLGENSKNQNPFQEREPRYESQRELRPVWIGASHGEMVEVLGLIQQPHRNGKQFSRYFVTVSYLVSQLYRWSCRRGYAPVTVKSDSVLVPAFQDAQQGTYIVEMARTDRRAAILDATATVDDSGTTLYLVNRNITEPITVEIAGVTPIDTHAVFRYVTADSPYSSNTLDAPDTVRIAEFPVVIKGGRAEVTIPACTAGALIAGPLAGALAVS
jgi:hypothetical protein